MVLNVMLVSNADTVLNPSYSRAPKHLVTPLAVWHTSKFTLRSVQYSGRRSNRMSDNTPCLFTSSPPCARSHSDHAMKTDALLPLALPMWWIPQYCILHNHLLFVYHHLQFHTGFFVWFFWLVEYILSLYWCPSHLIEDRACVTSPVSDCVNVTGLRNVCPTWTYPVTIINQ